MSNVQIQSFFWSVFSCIPTKYRDLRGKSPHSVGIQENTDQKKLRIRKLFTQLLFNLFTEKAFTQTNFLNRFLDVNKLGKNSQKTIFG